MAVVPPTPQLVTAEPPATPLGILDPAEIDLCRGSCMPCPHGGNFGRLACGVARRFTLVVLTLCAKDISVECGHHRPCKRPVAAIAVVCMAHRHSPLQR